MYSTCQQHYTLDRFLLHNLTIANEGFKLNCESNKCVCCACASHTSHPEDWCVTHALKHVQNARAIASATAR